MGQETFRLCRQLVDGIVLVDNSATSAAIKDVFNETRSILEPAGALSVAGAKAWLKRNKVKGGWGWRGAAKKRFGPSCWEFAAGGVLRGRSKGLKLVT